MGVPLPIKEDGQFLSLLQGSAKQLVDVLQKDEFESASKIIHELVEARDAHIFNSVGQLTRGLHTAIVNFHVDADLSSTPAEIKSSEISDATDRLNYVLKLTEDAADKTRREMSKEEFKTLFTRIDNFLCQMGEGTDQLNTGLQEIILEQGFQDLTGQALKKVITLVTDVERELVNLMRLAGQVENVTGLVSENEDKSKHSAQGQGPMMHAEERDDVVHGQDDVDDLLSSLGF